MQTTLQPILSCGEGILSDISVFLSRGGTEYEVYLGVALLERVGADPEVTQRKMLVGRLFNAGSPVVELGEKFGHDPRTIKKWGAALLSSDIDDMARAFAGRAGRRRTSPELIRYARQLYRERHILGRNYRQVIIEKVAEVFGVPISTTTASAIFASAVKDDLLLEEKVERAITLQPEADSSTEQAGSVKQSPIPLPAQRSPAGGGRQWIHHAGQVLFAEGMKGIAEPLLRQFIAQILQGAVNVEQSKTLCGRSLENFTGPVVNGLRDQRRLLDQHADTRQLMRIYGYNAELLSDGPNRDNLFFFDPHTKEYTGQLRVLKGWCGRSHGVVKALNLDSFHTRSGRPCFIQHHSPYYDMRERFFMALARFDLLFTPENRRGRTFVIDRGIYSLPTLQSFGSDYVITWEKNYSGDGWDDDAGSIAFSRSVPKNDRGDLRTTRFECQEGPWQRDGRFRKIIVRASKEDGASFEASIITSHPDMDVQDVVWVIFRRWLQENDFKYLDTHFGINQLTSHDNVCFSDEADRFEDRPVDSPEYRELKNSVQQLETQLGKLLVRQRKTEKQNEQLKRLEVSLCARRHRLIERTKDSLQRLQSGRAESRSTYTLTGDIADWRKDNRQNEHKQDANARTLTKLREQARSIEQQIEPLETQLCEAVHKQSRLKLLSDGNYRLLDTRKKALMDALRVTASNIFRNVQEQFRVICNNFRDDHVWVRTLSRCSGTIEKTSEATTFQLWLPGTLQQHRIQALERLLAEIEHQINTSITSARPVRIELLIGPASVR